MIPFAQLLDALLLTPARSAKLALIRAHLGRVPDPDRGWALAALTGGLSFPAVKPAAIRALIEARMDPELFRWSYDFVGDLAETAALCWPEPAAAPDPPPSLDAVVRRLAAAGRGEAEGALAALLDRLDATGRWALLKLVTGGLRVGVSAGLAKAALAAWSGRTVAEIEEVWHGAAPPYGELFAWLTGAGPRPDPGRAPVFRAPMLATPLEEDELSSMPPEDYRAEWKWDGIRVQLVAGGTEPMIFTRTGEPINAGFPDLVAAMDFDATLDGELLVGSRGADGGWEPLPFAQLQRRLNRKTVSAQALRALPAFVRLYDALLIGAEDLRPLPFDRRRARLEAWLAAHPNPRLDLSPLVPFRDWDELAAIRAGARAAAIEGLMLKQAGSVYVAGRPKGPWLKWKRAPLTVDAVLMYAQRGHGRRSSFYSDFTFGCWRDGALLPVGKAYSGFTDAELVRLDKWVRDNTVERYGPVRAVAPSLVVEVAFDGAQRSPRHKSGVALRFPRFARIRWDKPAAEADLVAALERLADDPTAS